MESFRAQALADTHGTGTGSVDGRTLLEEPCPLLRRSSAGMGLGGWKAMSETFLLREGCLRHADGCHQTFPQAEVCTYKKYSNNCTTNDLTNCKIKFTIIKKLSWQVPVITSPCRPRSRLIGRLDYCTFFLGTRIAWRSLCRSIASADIQLRVSSPCFFLLLVDQSSIIRRMSTAPSVSTPQSKRKKKVQDPLQGKKSGPLLQTVFLFF